MDAKAITPRDSPPSLASSLIGISSTSEQNEQGPRVDDAHLPRQKRKRTSPEDQTILEAAYKRDPKPDKSARLELVKQVALGEKEVQIWFQNRRQSSRRKSRPLLPHEVAQYQISRAATSTGSIASSHDSDGLVHYQTGESMSVVGLRSGSQASSDDAESDDSVSLTDLPRADASNWRPHVHVAGDTGLLQHGIRHAAPVSAPCLALAPVDDLATWRAAPPQRHSFSSHSVAPAVSTGAAKFQLKKSTSFVRLSMNAEGNAEVTTKDASSPSPPRPQQAVVLPEVATRSDHGIGLPPITGLKQSLGGRSRDSRSWEFWCDRESRSELEIAAKKDASGSAAGAIGLLRTASGRSILGSLPPKRNGGLQGHSGHVKRLKHDHNRRPLQRSSTSYGRLQCRGEQTAPAAPTLKATKSAKTMIVGSSDSDKENRSPGGESDSFSLDDSVQGHRRQAPRTSDRTTQDAENDPEADAELAAFMRGGRKESKASGDDDLDCIQGLLSLSQGNWR